MSNYLLRTKLQIPPIRATLIPRPRLFQQLDKGISRKLTILSAPAGFGKTSLAVSWLNTVTLPVAWYAIDADDNDMAQFLTYFTAALQAIDHTLSNGKQKSINVHQSSDTYPILASLINTTATFKEDFVFVLDDYHLITSEIIHDAVRFWVEHMPPQAHLLITTRETVRLPLARLRARAQMVELGEKDLSFTTDETTLILNQVMGLDLTPNDVTALEKKTEGWITGLLLAALSLQNQADYDSFINSFTGNHRFVFDYLIEEVWEQQSPSIKAFLLRTSILRRLSAPLCATLLDNSIAQGQSMLEHLEYTGLLIIPLDNERQWYRYHHLFADVLQARLAKESGNLIQSLHLRAMTWYAAQALYAEAIYHAIAAEAFTRAADLIEQAWPTLRQYYHETTFRDWVGQIPLPVLQARPRLNIYYALALLPIDPHTADRHLENIDEWLATAKQAQPATITQPIAGLLALARAYQAAARQQRTATISHAQQALHDLPDKEFLYRGAVAVLLGLTQWSDGQVQSAFDSIHSSLPDMEKAGNLSAITGIQYLLADIHIHQGQLNAAKNRIENALKRVSGQRTPQGTADLHVLLGELHHERNELQAAAEQLAIAERLGEHAALQESRHRWFITMAKIKAAQGDYVAALELLEEATQWQIADPTPDVAPIAAIKARLWIHQGELALATTWATDQQLSSIEDDVPYAHEFEQMTLAKFHLAQHRLGRGTPNQTMHLLMRLQTRAEAQRRNSSLIEIFVLKALLCQLSQDTLQAMVNFKSALQLASPENYVRVFIQEGKPMVNLLHTALSAQIEPNYVRHLLAVMTDSTKTQKAEPNKPLHRLDPLSNRELEILEHIAQGLTNQQIADRLYLSLYTIKAHARNIYSKLDVNTRTYAVRKAQELGILGSS